MGITSKPCSRTSSPTISTLRSLETLQWQTRHGKSGKTLPSAGGSANLTSPSSAPLPVVGFHLRTTSKRRSPFLPACTASTSTIRPGACLKSCVSPSQRLNLIHGTRMHMTPEPGRVAQSVGHLTRKSGDLGSIPGLATYFRFSFRFFKKGSCQLLAKVCARSTG